MQPLPSSAPTGDSPPPTGSGAWISSCAFAMRAFKPAQDPRFPRVAGDQMHGMDGTALSDAIDAADPLLEAHRVPRQLEVDDEAAGVVQIQPFARRVGRQQNATPAGCEAGDRRRAFSAVEAAVEHGGRATDPFAQVHQRVAVFGEDERRLASPPEQPPQRPDLRLVLAGGTGGIADSAQQPLFTSPVGQPDRPIP